jgi:stage III sporulation protein AC
MNVDLIFKIAAVGILIAVINQVLTKAGREEMATMTTLTGIVIVLLMVVSLINQLFNSVKSIFQLY